MRFTPEDKRYKKCLAAALRFLKIRPRSEHELVEKLKPKAFAPETIAQTLGYLKELNMVDDRAFARDWIRYRLQRPFGPNRIRYELIQKGIAKDILEEEMHTALSSFAEEDTVLDLAREKAAKYKGLEKQKIKQRVYGFLSRRGFRADHIYKALRKL